MRSNLLSSALAGVLATGFMLSSLSAAAAADVKSIAIVKNEKGKFVFTDADAKITEGETVRWVAVDEAGVHQLVPDTEKDALKDTGSFNSSAPVAQTFSKPGTIHYHCAIHPKSMRGTITVAAAKASNDAAEAPAEARAKEQAPARVETKPKKAKPSYGYGSYKYSY